MAIGFSSPLGIPLGISAATPAATVGYVCLLALWMGGASAGTAEPPTPSPTAAIVGGIRRVPLAERDPRDLVRDEDNELLELVTIISQIL